MKNLRKGTDDLSETPQNFLTKIEAHFIVSELSHHHCGCIQSKRKNILSPGYLHLN